jgi:hypothetical protein
MVDHELAPLSRALFKNAYVLPVAAVMLSFSDGRFTKHQVARVLGISDNLVTGPTDRFSAAGAVKATGLTDADGQHLERVAHPLWAFVADLLADQGSEGP